MSPPHGAPPIVEQQFMDFNNGLYVEMLPTYRTLIYECATPLECAMEQYQLAESEKS